MLYCWFMLDTTLLAAAGQRLRAYLPSPLPVRVNGQVGRLVYGTSDGYYGVQLLGEQRVDEYVRDQVEACS